MPFLLIPILWHKVSSCFRLSGVAKERAHGDKVFVFFNSPEAFEEAVWLAFMHERIETDQYLETVEADGYSHDLEQGLRGIIAKLIALSEIEHSDERRQYRYSGKGMLTTIADLAMVTERERLTATADMLRAPTTTPVAYDRFSTYLWQRAVELHEQLVALAIK